MKKFFLFSATAIVAAALLSSCNSGGIKPLTTSQVLNDVNKFMENEARNEMFTEVAVGTYECNDPFMRESLAKLEVAGLIEYDVTRYAWWEKSKKSYRKAYTVTRGYGWYSYTDTEYRTVRGTAYDFEDHYIVEVALTKKGEKLTVEELPEPLPQVDEDLVSKEVDGSKYEWNQVDLSENWEYIENPFIEKKEPKAPKESAPAETTKDPRKPKATPKVKNATDPTERIDILQYEAYMAVEEYKEVKFLKVGAISAVKARNIEITSSIGNRASVEVILETEDATDAGRILDGFEDGQKMSFSVTYKYFLDKGWVLDNLEEIE